ncbi:MAG: EAL domain-containing protein [Bacillota bacterium]
MKMPMPWARSEPDFQAVHRGKEKRATRSAPLHQGGAVVAVLAAAIVLLASGKRLDVALDEESYLPLHAAMEIFAVVVAAMTFSIGWHSFNGRAAPAAIALSAAFLAVGLLDIGHLLSFPGMPVFVSPSSVEKGIDFWLAARALAAAGLLVAAALPWGRPSLPSARTKAAAAALAITYAVYWLILFHQEELPATFIENRGLTPFKKAAEYVLVAAYLLASAMFLRRARETGELRSAHLASAACIMAMSEVCFTFYLQPTDMVNVLGHIYKVVAYLYLYRAIFVDAVLEQFRKLQESRRALVESEHKFRSLMESAPDAVLLTDRELRIVMMNAAAERIFGYGRDALTGMSAATILADGQGCGQKLAALFDAPRVMAGSFETACRRKGGHSFPAEISLGLLDADDSRLVIAIVRDVTERKHLEAVVHDQKTHDALTGLPNRLAVDEHMRNAIAHCEADHCRLWVMLIGIDHFKRINDTFGRGAGDAVLRESARRLHKCLDGTGMLARQGADEFIVLMQGNGMMSEVTLLAERLLACMRAPFHVAGREIFLTASLGIGMFPGDGGTSDALLGAADLALNSAKERGDCYCFYTQDMHLVVRERLELEVHLRYALENDEFILHYQPRVHVLTGQVVGVEALIRWNHPTLGMVSPGRFIPIAEESGLIDQIGMWALMAACVQAKEWQRSGLPAICISVNLSARQFQQADLVDRVYAILQETGLDPACLELEITESAVMKDTESAIGTLSSLKSIGVGAAIDDFGTGYASLSYLKLFPIDVLKVDQSFVRDVTADQHNATIARAIIGLAHSLDLKAVGEGVETLEQAQFLKACGCDELQGFYFSRPVPAGQIAALLADAPFMTLPDQHRSRGAQVSAGGDSV